LIAPTTTAGGESVYHLYTVKMKHERFPLHARRVLQGV
jgi:hypothetical protein